MTPFREGKGMITQRQVLTSIAVHKHAKEMESHLAGFGWESIILVVLGTKTISTACNHLTPGYDLPFSEHNRTRCGQR